MAEYFLMPPGDRFPLYLQLANADVIVGFKTALPTASIYVYDNCSTDNTADVARRAGAIVRTEHRKGKGNVVKRMFSDIEADVYVLADGDLTYEAAAAPQLISTLLDENCDMVVGTRHGDNTNNTLYRPGHQLGNTLFTSLVGTLFGKQYTDILSGYRIFSRRFVKSFPALSRGFDTEVELTIHSLELRLHVVEVTTHYASRAAGSESKLNKYKDGLRILSRVFLMLKETKPLLFFGVFSLVFALIALGLSIPLFYSYIHTGLVPRIPTAILCTGTMVLAFISLTCGIILDSVSRARKERKYLYYLSLPWLL